MIKDYFKELFWSNFGISPTNQQAEVTEMLTDFIMHPVQDGVFILRGFAGTGKTTLISALVRTMEQLQRECVLIAPTGRAAKVLASYSSHPAYTIHRRIYRQKTIDRDSLFDINYNLKSNILFICDEASMISNDDYLSNSPYGTGRLLDDLLHFVYNGKGCRLILLGDTAQLPPVGEGESPALQDDTLRSYGMEVQSYTMTQVVRQAESSGILWNATHLRQLMDTDDIFSLPRIRFSGFSDVKIIPGNELIEQLEQCYHDDGEDDTIVITRSNKRAVAYNNGIRNQVLWREELLSAGDRIMIAKNDYHWKGSLSPQGGMHSQCGVEEQNEKSATGPSPSNAGDFLANGSMAIINRVRNERELYGFHFADVELTLPDEGDIELECTVLLDTLQAEAPALTSEQQTILYNKVYEDYEEINIAPEGKRPEWRKATKRERLKAMRNDTYYNALQIKYAYAITCHKAQGGQWRNVFIDQGFMTEDMLGPDYFRWLYTAITRSTGTVYFVNWTKEQSF